MLLLNNNYILTNLEMELLLEQLPPIIVNYILSFDSHSERLIALYSAITCAGCLMTKVQGEYHRRLVFPHLYVAIIAPPSSNKGVITYAAKSIDKVNVHFKDRSDKNLSFYLNQMKQFNKEKKKNSTLEIPTIPSYYVVNISGNITGAKLIEQLSANQNHVPSFMVEDETDSLGVAASGEHGKELATYLRSCFHHGLISAQRKGGNQHYQVKNPKLAILIAGTPNQMLKLIGHIENGLYSRFMILTLEDGAIWQDVKPCPTCPDREQTFSELADEYFELWANLKEKEITVKLEEIQWDIINEFGVTRLQKLYNFSNELFGAVIKRHCLMAYKIAMTLTAIRIASKNISAITVYCTNEDFEIAIKMMLHSFQCSTEFFKTLPGGKDSATAKTREKIFVACNVEFTRAEAIEEAKKLKISPRQADRYLKELFESGVLEKSTQGKYKKTMMANLANGEASSIEYAQTL